MVRKYCNIRTANKLMTMVSTITTVFAILMVTAFGHSVDSASTHTSCESDHQCLPGYYCYEESHYCVPCVDCGSYQRLPSWRSCPKAPDTDCGVCKKGFEEEILHDGRTREMCVPSFAALSALGHNSGSTVVPSYERYLWAAGVTALFLPIVFYAFWRRDRRPVHRLPHEQPPPYRSIELTTLTNNSSNSSEECLAEENHVLQVGQQKDSLVQALPFRQPDYTAETESLSCENILELNSEVVEQSSGERERELTTLEFEDENTMPSDWTPDNSNTGDQMMNFELRGSAASLGSEEACEPATKRRRPSEPQEEEEDSGHQLNINLFINNTVTIHKPS